MFCLIGKLLEGSLDSYFLYVLSEQSAGLSSTIRVESILHPSPVNPTANKGWRDVVHKQLSDLGLMPYFYYQR